MAQLNYLTDEPSLFMARDAGELRSCSSPRAAGR